MRASILLVLLGLMLSAPAALRGQSHFTGLGMDSASGYEIEMFSLMNFFPKMGCLPVQVNIENRTARDAKWNLDFLLDGLSYNEFSSATFQTSLTAKSGDKTRHVVLLPVHQIGGDQKKHRLRHLRIHCYLRGPGLKSPSCTLHLNSTSVHGSPGWTTAGVVFSRSLGVGFLDKLKNEFGKGQIRGNYPQTPLSLLRLGKLSQKYNRDMKRALLSVHFDTDDFYNTHLAWSGVSGIWLQIKEWRNLTSQQRRALITWIHAGGSLFMAYENESGPLPELGLRTNQDSAELGWGTVTLVQMIGSTLDLQKTGRQILNLDMKPQYPFTTDYHTESWGASAGFDKPRLNLWLVLGFSVAFCAIIGPANFFLWATLERRHRLIFSIPFLSVLFSVLLVAGIFLIDGFGGEGVRKSLVYLNAGQNRGWIFQESISRTTMLLGEDFEFPEDAQIHQIMPEKPDGDASQSRMVRDGTRLSGSWFKSRSLQAHYIRQTQPTRAQVIIEFDDSSPRILSQLPDPLEVVYWREDADTLWKASDLKSGVGKEMAKVTRNEFQEWSGEVAKDASPAVRQNWADGLNRPGWFFASGNKSSLFLIETLPAIDWKNDQVLYMGEPKREGSF